MLTDDAKRYRHRATTISIHITATSWALEFVTGLIVLSFKALIIEEMETKFILFEVANFCAFVIIPVTYIFNTEATKEYLKSIGCYTSCIDGLQPNRVNPQQDDDIEMNVLPNAEA